MDLTGPRLVPAEGGPARSAVLLLHGYGADGNDLIGLAAEWASALPETLFFSPNAPFACEANPFGRQWFGFENKRLDLVAVEVATAAQVIDRAIDALLAELSITPGQIALAGFSQGTMMALHVGLRRSKQVAGILGYSGLLMAPELLDRQLRSKPPVLLIHGDSDTVVPSQSLGEAEAALKGLGVPVEALLRPGLAHGIDPHGLAVGGKFLERVLP
ncbi:MAG TPA: dienelactone hydrolase family protein [Alphaproteobacteria bacterium]|nr:dienelactone hydrolase family protein [Alphaproteobacteria bacterium]